MFRGEITAVYDRKTSLVFKANRVVNKSCSATSFVMQSEWRLRDSTKVSWKGVFFFSKNLMTPYTNNKQYHMKIELGIFNLNAHAQGSYTRTKHPKKKFSFARSINVQPCTTLYNTAWVQKRHCSFFAWLHIPAILEILGFLLSWKIPPSLLSN